MRKALMPPLSKLEKAIEQEIEALEDDRALPVPVDQASLVHSKEIDDFAAGLRSTLPENAYDDEQIESTARMIVRSFLDEFGSQLIERGGLSGFQEALVPGLKAVADRLMKE